MPEPSRDDFFELLVHESTHPGQVRQQVASDLRAGTVPAKLLYETPRQVRSWRDLASRWSPAMQRQDGAQAYAAIHSAAALQVTEDSPLILGLGCGDARKEVELVKALGRNATPSFMPVDASLPLIQVACREMDRAVEDVEIGPVLIDLERSGGRLSDLVSANDPAGTVRILTLYGVLPWMNPFSALDLCKDLMRPGDLLCVSANLVPEGGYGGILAQYDNEQCRSWLQLVLQQLEIEALSDGLAVQADDHGSDHATLVVSASVAVEKETVARFEGESITLESGCALRLLRSARYSPDDFQSLLERNNLSVEEMAISSSGEEAVALARL